MSGKVGSCFGIFCTGVVSTLPENGLPQTAIEYGVGIGGGAVTPSMSGGTTQIVNDWIEKIKNDR